MLSSEFWIECLRVVSTSIPAAAAVVAGVKQLTKQQAAQGEQIVKMSVRMDSLEMGQSVLMAHHGLLERVTEVSNALSENRSRRVGDTDNNEHPGSESASAEPAAEPCPRPGALPDSGANSGSPTARGCLCTASGLLNARGV